MGKPSQQVSGAVLVALGVVATVGALLMAFSGQGAWDTLGGVALDRSTLEPRLEPDLLAPHEGELRRGRGDARLMGRGARGARPLPKPADLVTSGGWESSLLALTAAREARPDRSTYDIVSAALQRARRPVTRQNLIFQMAVCVEPSLGTSWLAALARGQGADADDAATALAFLDDMAGGMAFQSRAGEPLLENGSIRSFSQHERRGAANDNEARDILRPYRALEVLLRRPYFGKTTRRVAGLFVPKRSPDARTVIDLLQVWMRRYPDHPGTDDVALYIARSHAKLGSLTEAARWYARASTTGDADAAGEGLRGFLACTELFLGEHELPGLLRGVEGEARLTDLLEYIRIRRLAGRGDLAGAIADVEVHAARRPGSVFGHAWAHRRTAPVSDGLSSGLEPLPADDVLRQRSAAPDASGEYARDPPWAEAAWPLHSEGHLTGSRLELPADQPLILPDVASFARQLRTWEALQELDRRSARARGDERADLAYKRAAVLYHDPDAFFPVYARHNPYFPNLLGEASVAPFIHYPTTWSTAFHRFTTEVHGEWRAAEAFAEFAADHHGTPLGEMAAFSQGQALRRFVANSSADTAARKEAAEALLSAFATFLRDYPESTMADDAERALAYWRKMEPKLSAGR